MLRRLVLPALLPALLAALIAAGAASAAAQAPPPPLPYNAPTTPWPPGAGAFRDDQPRVSAKATGMAQGSSIFRGRVSIQRRESNRDAAVAALETALEEIRGIGGVEIRTMRREQGRTMLEPANLVSSTFTPGQPLPTIPPRNQVNTVHLESATLEAEAPSRTTLFNWAARIPPNPAPNAQAQPFPVTPILTERANEDDPAWAAATRNALLAAERDARNAAAATGGELGRLVGMWIERLNYVSDGYVQVQVTAEYQITRKR